MHVANDAIKWKGQREELEVEWGRTFGRSSEVTGHQLGPVRSEDGGAAGGGVDTGGLTLEVLLSGLVFLLCKTGQARVD